jgi:hypothetical protein
MFVAK